MNTIEKQKTNEFLKKIDLVAPIIECICESKMEVVQQNHTKCGIVDIKYKCNCNNKGMVLLRPDGSYDSYIYDLAGKMIKHKSAEINSEIN